MIIIYYGSHCKWQVHNEFEEYAEYRVAGLGPGAVFNVVQPSLSANWYKNARF